MLPSLSSIEDELYKKEFEHHNFIEFVLSDIGKDKSKVVALVEDNSSTNRVFARFFGCVFVGCHSHRFALALRDETQEHQYAENRVR